MISIEKRAGLIRRGINVKGALTSGVTVDEIKEILLHATVYSGIPAGLEAFKAALEVLIAEDALGKT